MNRKGKNNPNYKDGRSLKSQFCKDCGKRISWQSKRCQHCHSKGKRNARYKDGRSLKQRHCIKCGKLLKNYKAKWCLKCWYQHNSGKNHYLYKENKIINKKSKCIDCDTEISHYATRCHKCANTGQNNGMFGRCGSLNPAWKGGISFKPYPLGWNKTFKEQIRYRDCYRCQLCGCPEVECNRKLDVHHIDYNKKNIKEENLISLCNSCHMKTNFNRKQWKLYFKQRNIKCQKEN